MMGGFGEAIAALIAGALLILIGLLSFTGRTVPGELWGLAGTVFGWFGRGQVGKPRGRRREGS